MAASASKIQIREKEFALIGIFLLVVSILASLFSSGVFQNDSGQIDWISLPLVAFPILSGVILMALASQQPKSKMNRIGEPIRLASLCFSLLILGISTALFVGALESIDWNFTYLNQYELEFKYAWMESLGISWHVGMDALSFSMVWMTTLIVPITMITTWKESDGWYYYPLLLVMEGALIGVFVALDLFMFYIFWELTLIPMFFLILKWGGANRRYAAQKFFIYTFAASVIMLLGIITLYFMQDPSQVLIQQGVLTGRTFDMTELTNQAQVATANGSVWLGIEMQKALFLMFMLGFLVKLPVVPFHTWLPDAHVEAPTGGSMLLAGVMLKMGAYGMFRIPVTMFPHALMEFQDLLMIIGMVSLVFGAVVCLGQINLKRMVAYSSVSHMGIVLLGIASLQPLGFAGAIFMMFAHGLISPMLFAVCGSFKHHYHTLDIGAMRGLAKFSPWMSVHMMFSWMASLGLPLLAGFVAEIAVLIAFWMTYGWWVLLPGLTLTVTAAYYLWSMQRTIFEGGNEGELPDSLHGDEPSDLGSMENLGMLLMAVFITLFGVLPWIMFDMMSGYSDAHFVTASGGLLDIVKGGK